jgi:phospholipase C
MQLNHRRRSDCISLLAKEKLTFKPMTVSNFLNAKVYFHQLAKQFILLDNYYCNGINSSDGHQFVIQGITTPYHEKDFSMGHCVYDYGTDPLSYGRCGFIWNHLVRKGISFRNFGETDLAEITKGKTWTDVYNSWKNKNDSRSINACTQ